MGHVYTGAVKSKKDRCRVKKRERERERTERDRERERERKEKPIGLKSLLPSTPLYLCLSCLSLSMSLCRLLRNPSRKRNGMHDGENCVLQKCPPIWIYYFFLGGGGAKECLRAVCCCCLTGEPTLKRRCFSREQKAESFFFCFRRPS